MPITATRTLSLAPAQADWVPHKAPANVAAAELFMNPLRVTSMIWLLLIDGLNDPASLYKPTNHFSGDNLISLFEIICTDFTIPIEVTGSTAESIDMSRVRTGK